MRAGVLAALLAGCPARTASPYELEQVGCLPVGALRGDAVLSGDGKTLVYTVAADPGDGVQVHALDLGTGASRRLSPRSALAAIGRGPCAPGDATVSHDGRRVVFAMQCGRGPSGARWRLYEHAGGRPPAPLGGWTRCAPVVSPQSLSGDGGWLVVSAACNPAHGRLPRDRRRRLHRLWSTDSTRKDFVRLDPGDACVATGPAVAAGGRHVAFLSDCDPLGANPTGATNHFLLDRVTNAVIQLTHAVHRLAGGRCGSLVDGWRPASGLFDPAAITAGSATIFPASCLDEADPGVPLVHRLWRVAPPWVAAVELSAPPCAAPAALRAFDAPAGTGASGDRVAVVQHCVDATDPRRGEQHLLVLDASDAPRRPLALLGGAGLQPTVRRRIGRPALDEAGRTLAVVSAEPPPGCVAAGPQLVVARGLDDPVLRRVTCGCGPG